MLRICKGINKIRNFTASKTFNILRICLTAFGSVITLYVYIACIYATAGFVMLYTKETLNALPFTLQNVTECVQKMMFLIFPVIIAVEIILQSCSLTTEKMRYPNISIKTLIGCLLILNINDISYYLSPWLFMLLFVIFLISAAKAPNENFTLGKSIGVMKGNGVRSDNALAVDDFRSDGEIYSCAIHEAGHYVAAKTLSMEIVSSDISLMKNESGNITGGCVSVNMERSSMIDKVCLFYAGYAAQRKYEADHKIMYYYTESSSQADFQNIAACLQGIDEKERYDSYHACKELTNKLIHEHWEEILKKAEELVNNYKESNINEEKNNELL